MTNSNEQTMKGDVKILMDALNRIARAEYSQGREGCTWGDTDYDSMSAATGYNQAVDNVKDIVDKALSSYQSSTKEQKQESPGVWFSATIPPENKGSYKVIGLNNKGLPTPPHHVWFSGTSWITREGCKVYYWFDEPETPLTEKPQEEDEMKNWMKVKELMIASMDDPRMTPEDWANICSGLFKITRK